MKKIAIIAAMSTLFAAGVQAAGYGIINFTGTVTSQTCNASVGGAGNTGTTAGTVTLPAVQAGVLSAAGVTAGQTSFNVAVAGCAAANPAGAGTVKALFEKGTTVDANGRLTNQTAGGASNVVLQLIDGSSNAAINVGDASQTTGGYATITGSAATLPYAVRYYATGAATAGAVTSSVTYSLIYQ
ncbi:type 1 fimbrial protein [Enterobacteriaceae bacterium 89]|nr:type 1 fimbrial protein [Enterobacteriaceae bacterium 89]